MMDKIDDDKAAVRQEDLDWPSRNGKDAIPESPDRSSPPLYEVELTASDEEDDGSVLELVIPMQRYQRVPTSSPKKQKRKVVKRYLYSMMCCARK